MGRVQRWSGREARALREAMRMSVRTFASFLGVSGRTISFWEEGGSAKFPSPDSQALLDTALARATAEDRERFRQALAADQQRRATDDLFVLVPPMEPTMIDRPADHDDVLALVTDAARSDEISVIAIAGPGGFGKTTLATQLVHDQRTREVFPEIVWVETGEECTPARVVELISDLCFHLDGDRPALLDPEQAGFHLARIMAERSILLVIDNVWSATDLQPFLLGAPHCVRLVTTRNVRVCPSTASVFRLGPMSAREVSELITRSVPALTSKNAEAVADLCCGWPLLATVVGASLSQDLQAGASPSQAVTFAADALSTQGPLAFDVWDGDQRRNAIGHAIAVSLASLDDSVTISGASDLRERYLSLAIFPASVPVPIAVLVQWWQGFGWTNAAVRHFCRVLADRSLIGAYLADRDAIVLHDVFRAYLRHAVKDDWSNLHRSLVMALRPASASWSGLDPSHTYMWRNLSYHLFESGEVGQLLRAYSSPELIVAKVQVCGYQSLLTDHRFIQAVDREPLDPTQRQRQSVGLVLTGSGYLLHGLTSADDIRNTLDVTLLRTGVASAPTQVSKSPIQVQSVTPPHDAAEAGHIGAIVSVSAKGNLLVSAGEDGAVRVWNLDSNTLRAQLRGHTGWIYATAISPDARCVASAGEDGLIRLWDLATSVHIGVLAAHNGRIRALAFTSDGRTLVSGAEDGQIIVWDLDRRAPRRRCATPGTPIWSIAILGNDEMIAAGGEDEFVRLYDLNTGVLLDEQAGHRDWVRAVASNSSTLLASGSGDRTVCIWDASTRRLVPQRRTETLPSRVRAVAMAPDGRSAIAACEDATLRTLNASGQVATAAMPAGVDWIRTIARLDDGSIIAGCEDGALRRWMSTTAKEALLIAPGRNTIWSAVTAHHGSTVVFGYGDGSVLVHDDRAMATTRSLPGGPGRVWSLAAGGDSIAAACGDGAIRVWSLTTEEFGLRLNRDMHRSWAVAISPDGSMVAGSDHRGHTRVWHLPTGELLWDKDVGAGRLRSLAFSGLGDRLAACGGNGTVLVWHAESGEAITEISNKGMWARAVALDAAGNRALIGMGTGEVHVHDLNTRQTVSELTGHTGRVLLVSFTAVDDRVVSTAADGTARVWSISAGQQTAQVRADTSGQCAAFDAETGKLLVVGANGITRMMIKVGN
ncbi:MAG TPA: NB-ARC domain-containing protein [Candidatus Limnocylindrales bacterium]|nr:NB-ARC domain-containing protein [Candidatus Limnocylindrales bacterium]